MRPWGAPMKVKAVPPEFAHAEITASVHCRQCGYNLRGQRVVGKCPECGLSSWMSVLDTVDPDASRLPNLSNPRGVGDGLWWLTLCMLLATLFVVARPVAMTLQDISGRAASFVPIWLPACSTGLSAVAALLGLLSVYKLAPPRGREPSAAVWRDIAFLAGGLIGWATIAAILWRIERRPAGFVSTPSWRGVMHITLAIAAVVTLLSLRDILAIIGQRSREYRTAVGGRQRIRDMIVALGVIGAAEAARIAGDLLDIPTIRSVGTVVIWISSFMVLVGMGYVVVNTAWIRQALRRPRPTFGQILLPPLPDDTTITGVGLEEETSFEVLGPGEVPRSDAGRRAPEPPTD